MASVPHVAAAVLAVLLGVAHSALGQRFVVGRMLRRAQPKLFGDDVFTKRTLLFQWHLLTLAWWGMAAALLAAPDAARVVAVTMGAMGLVTLVVSRGAHLAWVAMLAIAILAWVG